MTTNAILIDEPFEVQYHPYRFKEMQFMKAATFTAELIRDRYGGNIYLALSGGADSEFIARLFHRLNIPFIPIIVHCSSCNDSDVTSAIMLCEELRLLYTLLDLWEIELYDYCSTKIYSDWKNNGLNQVYPLKAIEYVKSLNNGSVIITGETRVLDHPNPRQSIERRFKFISDHIYKNVIGFYYYTLELTYAEMKQCIKGAMVTETSQEYKARVRRTRPRLSKTWPIYHQGFLQSLPTLEQRLVEHDMGTPFDFTEEMRKYII